jgi:hypothetical protein
VFASSTALANSVSVELNLPKGVCERTHRDALDYLQASPVRLSVYTDDSMRFFSEKTPQAVKAREDLRRGSYFYTAYYDDRDDWIIEMKPRFSMGVTNPSGKWKTGLCWWHSRLHRAAAYLAEFDPNGKKPDSAQAMRIYQAITSFMPVVIPGYESLADFNRAHASELEEVLSAWQRQTTFSSPGIAASKARIWTLSESARQAEIEERLVGLINDMWVEPRPIVLLLDRASLKGVHSVVVVGYQTTSRGGVQLKVLEPIKKDQVLDWTVRSEEKGIESLVLPGDTDEYHMIRTHFDKDFNRIEANLRTHCGSGYRLR